MRKIKLFLLLALLLTAATGAWAQESATTTYSVKMKDNTVDAKNWTIASGEKSAKGDAADGLTGLSEGQTVTLTYTGRLKVKGVKATSDAAAPAIQPFSVSDNTKVFFAPGNLQYNASEATYKWRFAENQYDYLGVRNVSTWIDLFGWGTWTGSTPNPTNSSSTNSQYSFDSGDFVQESLLADADQRDYDWRTLTKDEWVYLFNTRTTGGTVFDTPQARYAHATVNTDGTSVIGIILFPDGTDIASSEVTAAGPVNSPSECATKCTTAQWKALAAKGCVFLPAAGHRNGQAVDNAGKFGDYWSSVASGADNAYRVDLGSGILVPAANNLERSRWFSVRLVREVATSDEEPSAGPTYTLLSAATTSDCGKVVCAAGHLHDAKIAVPDGCTAVGILGKVTETGHGLILALKNATNQNWNTINGWASASYAGTTLKVLPDDGARSTNLASYTALGATAVSNWAVAQKSDYEAIFTNLGSMRNSGGMTYDNNVNAYITTGVGGTAMAGTYWSATQDDDSDAWYFQAGSWYNEYKTDTWYVRPVLGF